MKKHTFLTTKREFKKLDTMPLNMQVATVLRYAAFHTLADGSGSIWDYTEDRSYYICISADTAAVATRNSDLQTCTNNFVERQLRTYINLTYQTFGVGEGPSLYENSQLQSARHMSMLLLAQLAEEEGVEA